MREAYGQAKDGNLSLSALTARLNEIGEKKLKYDAIELCFDVMAADGVADEAELNTIRGIAESLELDYDEITKLRDQKLVELDAVTEQQASIESILDLDTEVLAQDTASGEDRQVFKHRLAPVSVAWGLDCGHFEGPPYFVDYKSRQGFTFHIFCDQE